MPKKIQRIATLDAETDPFLFGRLPKPFIWGFYDGVSFKKFNHIKKFLDYIRDEGPFIIYAHNGGKFDYHFMFDYLEPYSEVLIINGRLAKFTIGGSEFRDSYNILPIPLRDYRKDDIDYKKLEANVRDQHMPEIEKYLKTDCIALYELIQEFISKYDMSLTLAGAALKFWSEFSGIAKPESDQGFYQSLKKYYYGGRVQCFHTGMINKKFSMWDINSAYPYAMLHDHPFSTSAHFCIPDKKDKIIPQSFYTVEGISKGAFPWREDDKSALNFPEDNEERVYHVTGWELQTALDTETFEYRTLHQRVDFGADINFKGYIEHFYEMKKASKKNTPDYIFAKLFMNSLYGKFGANPDNYLNFGIIPPDYIQAVESDEELTLGKNKGPWKWSGDLGPWALVAGKNPETGEHNPTRSKFYNVATAASITGFVRAYLWKHICQIRKAGGNVFYCDTDSIVLRMPTKIKVPVVEGKELGQWGCDGKFKRGGIAGKKLYAFELEKPDGMNKYKMASKGVRIEPEAVLAVAQGGEVVTLNHVPAYSVHSKTGPRFINRTIRKTS